MKMIHGIFFMSISFILTKIGIKSTFFYHSSGSRESLLVKEVEVAD